MERLVVCQGTAQLVTAVSAIREHTHRAGMSNTELSTNDHLLICGLAVPEQQASEFSDVIETMAALLHPFASINRINDHTLACLIESAGRERNVEQIASFLQKTTGLGRMDEVFTMRNWQVCNEVILGAYPNATHICYGDSVGISLPKGFMAAKPSLWLRPLAKIRHLWPQFKTPLGNQRVDISYLLLPNAFGIPPGDKVVQTNAITLRDTFRHLIPLLDRDELEEIRCKMNNRSVWVFLGTNFSEQGLMTPEAEAKAYREWIEGLRPEPGTVLLIKSHPRDCKDKLAILERRFAGLFEEIFFADSVGSPYLPVEVLLLELKSVVAEMRCLTVSTACLGTYFVVESKTDIGLGEAIIERYFPPNRREQRVRHEQELRQLLHLS